MRNELNIRLRCQNARLLNITKDINTFKQLNNNYRSQNPLKSI